MSRRPRLIVLNKTCLEAAQAVLPWLQQCGADVVTDESLLSYSSERLREIVSDVDGIVGPVNAALPNLSDFPRLKILSLASSGFDSVDISAATRAGVVVTNAPARELGEVVADLTWGILLAVARQIPQHDRQIRAGNLARGMGISPWKKTLGIVGLGQIGMAVARRAAGFDMRIISNTVEYDSKFVAHHSVKLVDLETLLAESDFVSLHVRINEETQGMIGARQLAMMKPTAFIVNTARRELIDEKALAEALESGQIAGAALDDPPSEPKSRLLQFPNVVFTTHLGNRAYGAVEAVFRLAVQNGIDVVEGRRSAFTINPEAYEQRQKHT